MAGRLDWSNRTLPRAAAVLGVVVVLTILAPPPAYGQMSLNLWACKKLEPRSQDFFFDLRYTQCGNQFTAKDPYVGLVAHLQNVNDHTRVTIEVSDPSGTPVWSRQLTYSPTAGYYYPNIRIWVVLPLAADTQALAAENVRLTASMIQLTDKPAAERLGEWTLRVQADRAGTRTMKFTLTGP